MSRNFRALALSLLVPLVFAGCRVGDSTNTLDTSNGFGLSVIFNPVGSTTFAATIGGSNTATVRITRIGNFTGDVTLTALQVPSTVIITFNPSVLTTGVTSSVMTMTLPTSVPAGTSSFRLRSTGAPNYDVAVSIPLTFTN